MIIKKRVIEVKEAILTKASIRSRTRGAQDLIFFALQLQRQLLLLLFHLWRNFMMSGPSWKQRQGPGLYVFLIEESSFLFIACEYYLSSGSFNVEQLRGLGKCETLLLNHLNQLDSFLNRSNITSFEILEYLFLCREFYALSAMLY